MTTTQVNAMFLSPGNTVEVDGDQFTIVTSPRTALPDGRGTVAFTATRLADGQTVTLPLRGKVALVVTQ